MSPSFATLTELLNSLDAATYFFVSSGIFVGSTAVVFLLCGLVLGRIIWGRYKRRYRESEEVIEAFKGEVALLKRRIAEQSTRHAPNAGPNPLQAIAFKAGSLTPPARTAMAVPTVVAEREAPPAVARTARPAKAFTIWTEPGWSLPTPCQEKLHPARAFTLWAEPPPPRESSTDPLSAAPARTSTTATPQLLFSISEVFMVPKSRAHTLWTEKSWSPPRITPLPTPLARSFALWTLSEFEPACRGPRLPSEAFTLWTAAGWTPLRQPFRPSRLARSFTLWIEPDWKPTPRLPWSTAFSVWTEADWVPAPVSAKPLPLGAPWSIWTCLAYEPACRGAMPPSMAFSVWTEAGWEPAVVPPQTIFTARPFTLWAGREQAAAEVPKKNAPVPIAGPVVLPAATPASTATAASVPGGLIARVFAAIKRALGVPEAPSPSRATGMARETSSPAPTSRPATKPSAPSDPAPVSKAPALDAPPPVARQTPRSPRPARVSPAPAPPPKAIPMAVPASSPSEAVLLPARTAEPAKVSVKPPVTPPVPEVTLAATAATIEALRNTGRVPVMAGPAVPSLTAPLPPSNAFTIWGTGPAFAPAQKITQRIALAALIESKITGTVPLPPAAPALPPVPPVSLPPRITENPARQQGSPAPSVLDLEPLGVPEQSTGGNPH